MSYESVLRDIRCLWPAFDVVTAGELTAAGIGEKLRQSGVKRRILYRLRRGSYVRADLWDAATPTMRDLMRIRAHFLSTPHTGVYSHATAARLHGFYVWNVPPTIHLSQPFPSSPSSRGPDTATHHQHFDRDDVVTLAGPRGMRYIVTSPERTVVDCARILQAHPAAVIGDHALRKGADPDKVDQIVRGMAGVRSIRKARSIIDSLDPKSESPGETRTRLLFQSFNIPMPELQIEITSRSGHHRGDFGWRGLKLIAEFDGKSKYFEYRPTAEAIYAERQREKALMEEGWTFFRIEWSDLSHPWELKARLLKSMERAAAWSGLRAEAG